EAGSEFREMRPIGPEEEVLRECGERTADQQQPAHWHAVDRELAPPKAARESGNAAHKENAKPDEWRMRQESKLALLGSRAAPKIGEWSARQGRMIIAFLCGAGRLRQGGELPGRGRRSR